MHHPIITGFLKVRNDRLWYSDATRNAEAHKQNVKKFAAVLIAEDNTGEFKLQCDEMSFTEEEIPPNSWTRQMEDSAARSSI